MSFDAEAPPSYTEATTSPANPANPAPPSSPTSSSGLPPPSPLTLHLRTLPTRLHHSHVARQTVQAAHDFDLVTLLVPHVEAFLADLTSASAASALAVRVAELTLVPETAVPAGWAMSGAGERRREGEVVRVGRVGGMEKFVGGGGGGSKNAKAREAGFAGQEGDEEGDGRAAGSSTATREFDAWGRFDSDDRGSGKGKEEAGWWFVDEGMARRLATYLRPEANLERKQVQATVVERKTVEKEKSGWARWGLGGSRKKAPELTQPVGSPSSPSVTPVSPALSSPGVGGDDDSVKMTVRADEVTFRKENDFGVWESRSGWGVVVTVRIKP